MGLTGDIVWNVGISYMLGRGDIIWDVEISYGMWRYVSYVGHIYMRTATQHPEYGDLSLDIL